jgi:hypothetical protein
MGGIWRHNMKKYENRNVIHKNFGKGRVVSSYENNEGKTVLVIKFESLDKERMVYSDFYGM